MIYLHYICYPVVGRIHRSLLINISLKIMTQGMKLNGIVRFLIISDLLTSSRFFEVKRKSMFIHIHVDDRVEVPIPCFLNSLTTPRLRM